MDHVTSTMELPFLGSEIETENIQMNASIDAVLGVMC